jgi:chromosome segregation ATPase
MDARTDSHQLRIRVLERRVVQLEGRALHANPTGGLVTDALAKLEKEIDGLLEREAILASKLEHAERRLESLERDRELAPGIHPDVVGVEHG